MGGQRDDSTGSALHAWSAGGERQASSLERWLRAAAPHVTSWAGSCFFLFLVLKVAAVAWFLHHEVDLFSDYARWKVPFLLGTDLCAAVLLGAVLGVLASFDIHASKWVRQAARSLVWLTALSVAVIAAVNLRVVEAYRAALDRYLLRKVGDPSVMSESILANVDINFVLALAFGAVLVVLLPRWLHRRCAGWTRGRPLVCYGLLAGLATLPTAGAHWALAGRETFGLKHNAVLALAIAPPEIFQYAEPRQAYARLAQRLPQGPQLRELANVQAAGPATSGPDGLAGSGEGMNLVLLLLESVAARHVSESTMPTLVSLQQRSLVYESHHTNAVNTFDAHYALFRSLPVRGDAFVMRELHRGYSRDVSIMEVLKQAGYSVGMFHASFLNFIDTRWVWEAPGVDELVDAQDVISSERPGWSWGANDADVADEAVKWAVAQGKRKFFLVYNPAGSHHPYLAPRGSPPFPGDDCMARYKSALFAVDRSIAHLLAGLRAAGLERSTAIVVVSDHGELINAEANVCGHGMAMVDDELRVPFFIYDPAHGTGAKRVAIETSHWDVAPTIASLLGVAKAPGWLGRDLLAKRVAERVTFVGLDYRKHAAVTASDVIGDLDVTSGRISWTGQPPAAHARYEALLRSFDDRVLLHHAARIFD